jgi:cytochrome P450
LIGNGAAMLLEFPEVRTELAQDPSRWPAAIEELMRLVTPNQFIRRRAIDDIALGEQTSRAGDAVLLILAAANRDPEAFPDPDRFEFNRPQTVALGHGIHYCLGAPLARLEGRIALQTVFERWPAIHQAGELVYADNFNIRILGSLPVATS